MTDINEFPIEGKESNELNNTELSAKNPGKRSPKKRIFLGILLALILVVSIAGISFANKMKHFRDDGPLVFMMEKITQDIDLTEQQKSQVQQIKDEVKTKMESRKKDHESSMSDFENAFRQDNLDKTTLDAIADKNKADREEMKSFFEDELIKFHSVLTQAQRNKVADKIKDFRENHKFHDKDHKPQNN